MKNSLWFWETGICQRQYVEKKCYYSHSVQLRCLLEQKPTKTNLIFLPVTLAFPALAYNKTEVCPIEQDWGICKPKTHTKKRSLLTSPCLPLCYPTAARCPVQPRCHHRTHCHHSAFSGGAHNGQLQASICTKLNIYFRAANVTSNNNNN